MQKKLTAYLSSAQGLGVTEQNQLRQLVERYPYFAAPRLLLLRSLYQSHDPSFSAMLRDAAIYVPSRSVLYSLIEEDRLKPQPINTRRQSVAAQARGDEQADRTGSLIDSFLGTLPDQSATRKRRPVAADATVDYMAYLQMMEEEEAQTESPVQQPAVPALNGEQYIDKFIKQNSGHVELVDRPDKEMEKPQIESEPDADEGIFTETLARIYIKQGKFDKALEIIRKLSLKYPKKNRYFADQIRFLEKLIINNKNK